MVEKNWFWGEAFIKNFGYKKIKLWRLPNVLRFYKDGKPRMDGIYGQEYYKMAKDEKGSTYKFSGRKSAWLRDK